MKKLIFTSLLIIAARTYAQVDWSNYSTSVQRSDGKPSLGVAIPYNGNYDNFTSSVVGISHWNAQYKLGIDTTLDAQIPLYFVYDTAGIYFLLPNVNERNARDFEFTVLLNNQIILTPWLPVSRFTHSGVGALKAGSGISGSYRAGIGQYLVALLRNKKREIISSRVVYFRQKAPGIKSLSTSDNALVFSNFVTKENHFTENHPDVGWHRRYTRNLSGGKEKLKLSYNENNVLIDIDARIYQKDALEYAVFKDGKEIRTWSGNEYNNHYILLKNLDPGDYRILIRFRRQPQSITGLQFSISNAWYHSAAFRAAIFAFLVLTIAFLVYVKKYRKQKKALAQLDKKAERTAGELKNIHTLLNPHFTFNALSSIQGLVNKNDVDAASKYLSSFGELLRETLKESKMDLIPITKELDNLKTYIGLEQLRYSFTYTIHTDPGIDLISSTIPPFLLQPFVENAIKHGLSKINGRGGLLIHISKSGDSLLINITDNGPGFDTGSVAEGYGLSLSRKRIELLNRDYGEELIRLQMESTNKGTSILLSFKHWLSI